MAHNVSPFYHIFAIADCWMTDRQTDRHTNRQTDMKDRQTDRQSISIKL